MANMIKFFTTLQKIGEYHGWKGVETTNSITQHGFGKGQDKDTTTLRGRINLVNKKIV